MFKSGLAVLFLLASWFSAACAYELLPAHVAVVYNGKSELSRRMAREYARVRGVPEGNLVSLDCPMTGEISRKEYEETIRVPVVDAFRHCVLPLDEPEDFCAGADGGPADEDTA